MSRLLDLAARAYLRWLRDHFPSVDWVRVLGEDERLGDPVAAPLPGDVDLGVGSPDDEEAAV